MSHFSKFRRGGLMTALIAGLLVLATACGTASPSKAANSATASGPAGKQALTLYCAGPAGLEKKITKDFEKKTGIKVSVFDATTGKILARLQAEKSNPKADVVILADWSAAEGLKEQGMTLSYKPKNSDQLIWFDPDYNYFAYSASALGITYNTKEVKTPPRDWQDALTPAFKNKVVMPDPAQSGSALDFTGAYLQNHQNSWDFFKALKANGAIVQGANAESLNQVLTGAKSMVLAGVDYMAYADKAKGEPIDIIYPSSGTVVNPRPVMILKSTKNLTAAQKYVDFLLSHEGQQDVVNAYLLPGRKDISVGSKRAGLAQIKQFKVDWKALTSDEKNVIRQLDNILGQ